MGINAISTSPACTMRSRVARAGSPLKDVADSDDAGVNAPDRSRWLSVVGKLIVPVGLVLGFVAPLASANTARLAPHQIRLQTHGALGVAAGARVVVQAGDTLSQVVERFRQADGSPVPWEHVRSLNPRIFARHPAGDLVFVGDAVTLPKGARLVRAPTTTEVVKPASHPVHHMPALVATPVHVAAPEQLAPPGPDAAVHVAPAPVAPAPPIAHEVATPIVAPVVEAEPAIASNAAFKFQPLHAGQTLSAGGVFTTKQFFKLWTIDFGGTAKVIASDANTLKLQVHAVGKSGIFDGKSRTVAIEFSQDPSTGQVRFSGRDMNDAEGSATMLTVTQASARGTVLKNTKSGEEIRITTSATGINVAYGANAIRMNF